VALSGEGADGALADHGVVGPVAEGKTLGVAHVEPHPALEAACCRSLPGPLHGALPEIDPVDLDGELLGQEKGGGARAAGHVENPFPGPQPQGPGQPAGQVPATGVVAVAQDESDEILAVDRGAAGLERLGVHPGH
jgi:hypothetical protein